ncbi:hypothetical protein XarbCFBP7629_11070 [Xanthomonas arboricola]|nr:hypothetical protein XarbCFBP7629_11070 [Xanthomonas arboricola]
MRAKLSHCLTARGFAPTLTTPPAPRPGPRLRRGRSKAHAPVAPKPCLLTPEGEGLCIRALKLQRFTWAYSVELIPNSLMKPSASSTPQSADCA